MPSKSATKPEEPQVEEPQVEEPRGEENPATAAANENLALERQPSQRQQEEPSENARASGREKSAQALKKAGAAVDKLSSTTMGNPRDQHVAAVGISNTNVSLRVPELPADADPYDPDVEPLAARRRTRPAIDTATAAAIVDRNRREAKRAIRDAS